MTKLRLAAAGAVAGVVTLVASPAMAYPDPVPGNLGGTAADGVVAPGQRITLTGDFGGTDCNPYVAGLTPSGQTTEGSGTTFAVDFANPGVGSYVLSIVCSYDDQAPASPAPTTTAPASANTASFSQASLAAAPQVKTLNFAIVVGDDATGGAAAGGSTTGGTGTGTANNGGALPNTGGSNLWLAVAAAALVVAGATTYTVQRRKA